VASPANNAARSSVTEKTVRGNGGGVGDGIGDGTGAGMGAGDGAGVGLGATAAASVGVTVRSLQLATARRSTAVATLTVVLTRTSGIPDLATKSRRNAVAVLFKRRIETGQGR